MKKPRMTLQELQATICAKRPENQHFFLDQKPIKAKSKFGNNPMEVDGIRFDSTREANRYSVLKLMQKYGQIGLLERQVPYELNPDGSYSYRYIADFVYIETASGQGIVEDCKGYRTREYRKKKRLMEKIYGIKIKET